MKIKIVKKPDKHDKKYYIVLCIVCAIGLSFINYFNYFNIVGLLLWIVLVNGYTAVWDWIHDEKENT